MNHRFSPATAEEHEAIDALMVSAFTPYVVALGRGPTAGPYPWLSAAIDDGLVYVGYDDVQLVGALTTTRLDDRLIVDQLAVDPTRQGSGIGAWMMGEIEAVASAQGFGFLGLNTPKIFDRLVAFYVSLGFEVTHEAAPAHGNDDHPRLHFAKPLVDVGRS